MKIAIIGASGTIGAALARTIAEAGHQLVRASRRDGVDAISGQGLSAALHGVQAVIDAANSPDPDETAARTFFTTATRNLADAARAAGVAHYLALSVVGTDGLQSSGYFRAKLAHEQAVAAAGLPYTIVRATQVFEFIPTLIAFAGTGDPLLMPSQPMQPLAADDAAAAVLDLATGAPADGIREVAGPEVAPVAEFARRWLAAAGDARRVADDPDIGFFGAPLTERSLVAGRAARIMPTRFDDWLADRSTR